MAQKDKRTYAAWFLIALVVIITVFDIFLYKHSEQLTISQATIDWLQASPQLFFWLGLVIGYLLGHLTWPQRPYLRK